MPENRRRKRPREQEEEGKLDFGGFDDGSDGFHRMTSLERMLLLTRWDCSSYIGNGQFKSPQKVTNGSETLRSKRKEPLVPSPKRIEPVVPPPIAVKVEIEEVYEVVPADFEKSMAQEEVDEGNCSPPKLESPRSPGSEDYDTDEMPILVSEHSNSSTSIPDHQNSTSSMPMPTLEPENSTLVITNQSSPSISNKGIQQSSSENQPIGDNESELGDQKMSIETRLRLAPKMFEDFGILTPFERMLIFTQCGHRGKHSMSEDNQGGYSFVDNKQMPTVGRPRRNDETSKRNLKTRPNSRAANNVSSNPATKKKGRRAPSKAVLPSRKEKRKEKKANKNLVPKPSLLHMFLSSEKYSSVTSLADQFCFLQTHVKNSI